MKKAKWLITSLVALLIVLGIIFVRARFNEPVNGHGPEKEITVTPAWNGEKVQIPAPIRFPECGKDTKEYRRWRWTKHAGDFTTFDLEGYKYVADGHGFGADPQDPQGRIRPIIGAVSRYAPDGTRESYTSYNFRGPSEWYLYDKNGHKTMQVRWTGIGMNVLINDAEGKTRKEWCVNRKGQV